MTRFQSSRARGFTLIEMSIVLIIIGLIIGGILKGQELIESARQKNLMSQIDGLRAATNTFFDRFKALPGDYTLATTNIHAQAANGTGDGILNTAGTDVAALIAFDGTLGTAGAAGELRQYFTHLTGANLLGGTAVVPSTTALTAFAGNGVLSPLPPSSFPNTGLTIAYGVHEGAATNGIVRRSAWLRVHTFVAGAVVQANGNISPQRMFQLDTKYDDTLAYAGRIRSSYTSNTGTADDCGVTTGTGGNYAGLVTIPGCIALFDVLD